MRWLYSILVIAIMVLLNSIVCIASQQSPLQVQASCNSSTFEGLYVTPLNMTEKDLELRIDTSNVYSDLVDVQSALDEVDDAEGDYPIYVLVFADEDERKWWEDCGLDWAEYAISIIEQADEALIANFGIDIRILATISFDNLWKTEDNLETMEDIWLDLESETYIFQGCFYTGAYWQNYVDAIIGITAHATNDYVAGLAPGDELLDQGRTYILVKWQAWWLDDNVVQHEISHLFYTYDHYDNTYCIMGYRYAYKTNTYCTACFNVITLYKRLYENYAHKLVIRHENPYNPKGQLSHLGVYTYSNPTTVTVSAFNGDWWIFSQWVLDGYVSTANPIEVNVNKKRHILVAYFEQGYKLTITIIGEGSTTPPQGEYWYKKGAQVTVTASQENFEYWELDGAKYYNNPITVTMNRNHQLRAYFEVQQSQPPPLPPTSGGDGSRKCFCVY
ncbi:MAG: hypothetical protein QXQ50_09455 [Candidatus Bathyarchaeia archaeon]